MALSLGEKLRRERVKSYWKGRVIELYIGAISEELHPSCLRSLKSSAMMVEAPNSSEVHGTKLYEVLPGQT